MNPYDSSETSAEVLDVQESKSDLDLSEHFCYPLVLKMVLWGEPREEIEQRLETNGVSRPMRVRLYEHAWAERVRSIRHHCLRKAGLGAGLLLVAVLTFFVCDRWFMFIPVALFCSCCAAIVIGMWRLLDGLTGFLRASHKTGSVAEDL